MRQQEGETKEVFDIPLLGLRGASYAQVISS